MVDVDVQALPDQVGRGEDELEAADAALVLLRGAKVVEQLQRSQARRRLPGPGRIGLRPTPPPAARPPGCCRKPI